MRNWRNIYISSAVAFVVLTGGIIGKEGGVKGLLTRISEYKEEYGASSLEALSVVALPSPSFWKDANLPGPLFVNLDDGEAGEAKFTADEIIEATNSFRVGEGEAPLAKSELLSKMAEEKLDDMFLNEYFEHVSPRGTTIEDLAEESAYDYLIVGENLALGGFQDASSVVTAWSESPPHKKNMLDSRYTEIGIAVGRREYDGKMTTIVVEHLGRPLSSCSNVSEEEKINIENREKNLVTKNNEIEELKKRIEEAPEGEEKEALLEEHNKKVRAYNASLASYRNLIANYNIAVKEFNACIEEVKGADEK